jgi:molybdopterin converting factor small subunit
LITVRLLGGVKKLIGENTICIREPVVKMSYVMDVLRRNSPQPSRLNFDNIIIAVNGIDSSVLGGRDALAREGDEVTVVSIVHGGSRNLR